MQKSIPCKATLSTGRECWCAKALRVGELTDKLREQVGRSGHYWLENITSAKRHETVIRVCIESISSLFNPVEIVLVAL